MVHHLLLLVFGLAVLRIFLPENFWLWVMMLNEYKDTDDCFEGVAGSSTRYDQEKNQYIVHHKSRG